MSDTGDCAFQEIEASTSSKSTKNSMKCTFVQSILNTENSQIACSSDSRIIVARERVPALPVLEKNDFIQNWIIAHSSFADPAENSCSKSPILGLSSAKRSPQSPILGYQWKRIKREESSKENCRVSLSKKFQQVSSNPLVTARITIEHEICSNSDVDETLNSVNSPVLNKITNSPSLNTIRRSCRFGVTKSPSNSDGDSTLKWDDRKRVVRENTEIPETLSLSSPLCKRNNLFKVIGALNDPKQTIEALNKQLLKNSELLVEESPFDVEIISSSSKIPETLSHSTIGDVYGEVKADPNKSNLAKYDFQANGHINKLKKLHRSPSTSSSIKIETETSSDNDRGSQDHESSNSSVRLSIPSPFRKKKLIGGKSYNASWLRGKTSPVKFEAVDTSPDINNLKKSEDPSSIPDTLSVSSQLRECLFPESSISLYQLSVTSALREKTMIASSPLVESIPPDRPDSSDRSSIPLPLKRKKPIDTKSINTITQIRINAKNKQHFADFTQDSVKSEATRNLHVSERSKKNCTFSQIPDTLSVSSQLPQNLVNESFYSLNRLSNHSLLKQNKFIDLQSNNTSWSRAKNCPIQSEVIERLQGAEHSKRVRETLQIPDTVSISSQLDEIFVHESSESPNLLSLSAPLDDHRLNPPMMRIKDTPMTFEVVASANCNEGLIEIGESFKLSKNFSELIEVESSTADAGEDDIKNKSDSDCTISDFIENPATQNAAAFGDFPRPAESVTLDKRSQDLGDRYSKSHQDTFCDSDETYYSGGDSISRLRIIKGSSPQNSQQISQATSQSHESRIISQAASPLKNNNCEPPSNVMSLYMTSNNNKKKKKRKKGSLVAKLQTIVNSQISKLRIWRYQMTQPNFKNACTQFVKLKVRERETRFGRHYLTTSVIEDSHDLLKSIFESESNLSSEKGTARFEPCIVTLVIVPEIIGVVKIPAQSTLKIYPPWEITDRSRKVLTVMFFNVSDPENTNVDNKNVVKRESKNVIEDFECPCIRAKTLIDSCPVKFSNTKTNIMQEMFNS